MTTTAPYRANRTVALLSKIFSLAIKWEEVTENPTKGIERNPDIHAPATWIEPRWNVCLPSWRHTPIKWRLMRFVFCCSPGRAGTKSCRRPGINLIWKADGRASGQREAKPLHRVPLSSHALELLRDMRSRARSDLFLFPSADGDKPITDIKKSWASICKRARLEGVRLHDLRHTYASTLASSGNSLPVIGALLGHTQAQTTHRYSHLFDDPLRAATETVGTLMSSGRINEGGITLGKKDLPHD